MQASSSEDEGQRSGRAGPKKRRGRLLKEGFFPHISSFKVFQQFIKRAPDGVRPGQRVLNFPM